MSSLQVNVTVDNTLGAILVGFAVACVLYGVLLSQVFSYFSNYPLDRPVYKLLVVLILLMETADQAFIGHIIYHYGITNFAKPLVLLRADETWSLILQQTIGAIVGTIVKMHVSLLFFKDDILTHFPQKVLRVESVEIERNWLITGLVVIIVLGQLGLSLAFTVKAFQLPNIFAVSHLKTLGTVALAAIVLTDIAIAGALSFFLNRLRTGYRQSDTLVNTLVRYAVNTGAVTGAVSLTTLILYNLMPNNLVFIATYFILSKLYAISFMATLNTRRIVRGKGTDKQGTSNYASGGNKQTNMFHLGTRRPSCGPNELEGWEAAYTPSSAGLTSKEYTHEAPPFSSYHHPGGVDKLHKAEYGEAI
ncbi:hypothetical protein V5O48_009077 [Marasmius crinis-equi]|uniref:DUF6534 domain-containing protein n=1 Tax=Marasmius crinis-equi TaxID=585013 RepID=A0ABR3FCA6_9AGAR